MPTEEGRQRYQIELSLNNRDIDEVAIVFDEQINLVQVLPDRQHPNYGLCHSRIISAVASVNRTMGGDPEDVKSLRINRVISMIASPTDDHSARQVTCTMVPIIEYKDRKYLAVSSGETYLVNTQEFVRGGGPVQGIKLDQGLIMTWEQLVPCRTSAYLRLLIEGKDTPGKYSSIGDFDFEISDDKVKFRFLSHREIPLDVEYDKKGAVIMIPTG